MRPSKVNAKGVVLKHISIRYGNVTALNNVSLEIMPGELISLLGPSGCGKTTLLRAIAGFAPIEKGEILIGGVSCADLQPAQRNIGMVFQDYALFPHMTVARNIAFGLRMRNIPPEERGPLVKKVVTLLSLEGMEERYPRQLSGGQQQRVALARALVVEPGVLLLDEPLAALDKKLREEMQIELRSLQKRVGITTVFVTHDQEEALSMSDRVAVLEEGRIIQLGTPMEIYERPLSQFSGLFVGKSNLLGGRVVFCQEGESSCQVSGIGTVAVRKIANPGAEVRFLLRPEKIRLSRGKPVHSEKNCTFGKIENQVYLGMVTEHHLKTDQGFRLVVILLNTDRTAQKFDLGESLWASWSSEDLIQIEGWGSEGEIRPI
jgi:spermidine/putrescine ABC transporter ATP-binding subunit